MFRNYLKIGFRSLRKQPFQTTIFISGLALGLTAFLFLQQYTAFEKSYDDFHYASDQLYRVTTDQLVNGKIDTRDAMSFAGTASMFIEEVPEVINATTTYKTERMVFRKRNQPIEELNVIAVDTNFLDLFAYSVLEGDKKTMLSSPFSIVLTKTQAAKYFGEENPIGKTIEDLDEFNQAFTVTGIIEDIPENTHYHFDILVSLSSYQEDLEEYGWDGYNYYSYVLLDASATLAKVEQKLPALAKKYIGEDDQLFFNLQPVKDIHLHSDFTFEPQVHGSAKAVNFLSIISIFILLIAWINYINLSTAKAVERAKEVGLRKVVGAQQKQLIGQFFFESLLINLFGAVAALLLAFALTPYFNGLVGNTVIGNVFVNASFLGQLAIFFVIGTVATGFYPAIVLSSFQPINALRGAFSRTPKGVFLRKLLVVVQFAASLLLIASTVIIYKQVNFLTATKMGMDTTHVIGFERPAREDMTRAAYLSKIRTFENALLTKPGIKRVGGIQNMPGGESFDINSMSGAVSIPGKTDIVKSTVYLTGADDNYLDVLNIATLAGRNFDREIAADSNAVMVNTAFLNLLNIPDPNQVVGELLQLREGPNAARLPIVGVIDDFNRSSLKQQVEPTIFYYTQTPPRSVVKLSGEQMTSQLDFIQATYRDMFPNSPFAYTFLDERFAKIYAADRRFGIIFLNFSVLAIFVACMGLLGLSSYLALQRTKEVGIRKVLGASVQGIVLLFFRDFLWLILIAVLIGIPITYLGMSEWLAGYAHRIAFPWWVLSGAVLTLISIAFLTVSYQTWRLAIMNPTSTLRQN